MKFLKDMKSIRTKGEALEESESPLNLEDEEKYIMFEVELI